MIKVISGRLACASCGAEHKVSATHGEFTQLVLSEREFTDLMLRRSSQWFHRRSRSMSRTKHRSHV